MDEQNKVIHENVTMKQMESIYGITHSAVYRRVKQGLKMGGGHKIVEVKRIDAKRENVSNELLEEWDKVTSKIRNKVEWTTVRDKNTRTIVLSGGTKQ